MGSIVDTRISFIIPTVANRENLICLLNQLKNTGFENYEVIVILQTSFANDLGIVENLKKHLGIRLIINNGAKSSGSNRNIGASVADGQFLCFIDDDISLDSSFIKVLRQMTFDPNTIYFPEIRNEEFVPFPLGDHVSGRSYVSACFVISNRGFLLCGPFNEELNIYREDSEFFIRARKKGLNLYFLENAFVWHPIRFANGKTLKSYFTKNMLEPLFHKITKGNYEGVLHHRTFSLLPSHRGVSIVTYFVVISATVISLMALAGQLATIAWIVTLYLVFSASPVLVFMRFPFFFIKRVALLRFSIVAMYLLIIPEIFVARVAGSIKYRHFAI